MNGCLLLSLWEGRAKPMARKRRAMKKGAKSPVGTKIRRKRQRRKRVSVDRSEYAKLIMNPCMGPLVRAVGGDAGSNIVERVRSTFSFPITSTNTCGYLVWFPGFCNTGTSANLSAGNVFYYECTPANQTVRPVNTIADPMGHALATSGTFYPDPACDLVGSTSPFSRARTIAACLQLESVGQISAMQGMVATVCNISLATFNTLSGGTAFYQPPSVSEMLAYAAKRERLSMDGHEVIWGPNEYDASFRTNGDEDKGTVYSATSTDPNSAFWKGNVTATPTMVPVPNPGACMGVLFAWSSVMTGGGHIVLNATKVVELELAPRGRAVEQNIAPAASGGTLISSIVEQLDSEVPGWRAHAIRAATSAATRLTGAVLAGAPFLGNVGRRALRIPDSGRVTEL